MINSLIMPNWTLLIFPFWEIVLTEDLSMEESDKISTISLKSELISISFLT